MTVKCKDCGASYDIKYKVCPACGAVRRVLPLWSRVTAAAAVAYLILTFVMLLAGAFDFGADGDGQIPPERQDTPAPPSETAEPTRPAATPAATPDGSPGSAPPSATPAGETPGIKPVISSIYGSYDEDGFTWYLDREPLRLSAAPKPENGGEPVWTSSDESVFTVSETGVLTPVSVGRGRLTVSYGPAETSIPVYIAASINTQTQTQTPPSPVPQTPEPEPDDDPQSPDISQDTGGEQAHE